MDHELLMSLDRMREHLARAEGELEAAQKLLDPRSPSGIEINRAIAEARVSVGDAMETVSWRMSETESG